MANVTEQVIAILFDIEALMERLLVLEKSKTAPLDPQVIEELISTYQELTKDQAPYSSARMKTVVNLISQLGTTLIEEIKAAHDPYTECNECSSTDGFSLWAGQQLYEFNNKGQLDQTLYDPPGAEPLSGKAFCRCCGDVYGDTQKIIDHFGLASKGFLTTVVKSRTA